jgi:hypothetical protein
VRLLWWRASNWPFEQFLSSRKLGMMHHPELGAFSPSGRAYFEKISATMQFAFVGDLAGERAVTMEMGCACDPPVQMKYSVPKTASVTAARTCRSLF